jgi:hypothetical protein
MRITLVSAFAFLAASIALAQPPSSGPVALTIYNQDFAVARAFIDLDLHPGLNEITTADVTGRLEPDSVVLRDPSGKRVVHIIEQNYDAAVVSQEWLLDKYEGKAIDFQISPGTVVQGKIIRAGYQRPQEYSFDGQQLNGQYATPLIEVNGKMQFQLPGMPLFPATTDGLLLKPTLRWQIQSDKADRFTAELAYITGGLNWEATYNVVVPNSADVTGDERADVLGWVTIHNLSGTEFPQARIKLMAGDVAKLRPENRAYAMTQMVAVSGADVLAPQVTQKPFDDFHLYDLNRTVSLRDDETKQVQFIDASDVTVRRSYIYDGTSIQPQPYCCGNVNQQQGYGLDGDRTQVNVVEQIKNSETNHLGMPLPAGRVRLYRRDSDGQMEFVGESMINHTPAEQMLGISTGSAFDIKGARRQTDFHIDDRKRVLDETFEIKLTNQKAQPVNVNVVEHLYRGDNWEINDKSADYTKLDSHTVQFPIQVPAKGETTLTYSVRYTW